MIAGVGANLAELVGMRQLAVHQAAQNKALERLSTGKRINRGADDPSGVIAANNLSAQAAAIAKTISGLEQQTYKLGAMEGAFSVIEDLTLELESVVLQAANGDALSEVEREGLQLEADGILEAIDHIFQTSTFKGEALFVGWSVAGLASAQGGSGSAATEGESAEGAKGAGAPEPPGPEAADAPRFYSLLELRSGGALNLVDGNLGLAQDVAIQARKRITDQRAAIGTQISRVIEPQIDSLRLELEGTLDARSRIEDADFAHEVSEYVRSQVLAQAATFVIQRSRDNAANAVLGLLG